MRGVGEQCCHELVHVADAEAALFGEDIYFGDGFHRREDDHIAHQFEEEGCAGFFAAEVDDVAADAVGVSWSDKCQVLKTVHTLLGETDGCDRLIRLFRTGYR